MYQNYNSGLQYGSATLYTPPSAYSSTNHVSHGRNIMSQMNETSALALLQHLDKNELQHLIDNESKLKDLVDDLPQVKSLQSEHDNLVATNKSLAEYNLSLQPRLENLKQHIASEYETVNSLKTNLIENKAKFDDYVGRQSLDTMLALLQTETAKSEEASEQLADDFCSGDKTVEEFLSEYLPKRTQTHLRRIKSERLAELIRDSQNSTRSSGNHANSWNRSPQTNVPPYPSSNAAPYPPNTSFGMPQPILYKR